jgi:hypothetical protein
MEPNASFCSLVGMAHDDSFSIRVESAPGFTGYCWSTYRSGMLSQRSKKSFATRGEAAFDAVRTIERRLSARLRRRRAATAGVATIH